MVTLVSLEVSKRGVRPRSLRNKLRHEGKVLAIICEYKVGNTPISSDGLTLSKLLCEHGTNTVITMDIDGRKASTLVHKIQTNTFINHFEHVEFLFVSMSEEAEVEAEIVPADESVGAKPGGVLAQNLYIAVVSTIPDKLPEQIEVDVANSGLGGSITVTNPSKNDDYKSVTDSEEQVAAVVARGEGEESTGEDGEPEATGSIGEQY